MSLNAQKATASKGNLQVGDILPNFTLPDQNGQPVHMADFIGKNAIVLYFYPKDETRGCTAEACAFRDSYEAFKGAGATVIGVSSDTVESHRDFANRHHLPFVLLADTDGAVRKLLGVSKTLGILPGRVTYVIDKQGVVRHHFVDQMNATRHINEALQVLKTL